MQKYGYIKKKNGIEEPKVNDKINNMLKIETLNFNILKYQEPSDCGNNMESINNQDEKPEPKALINSKTHITPINNNPNPNLYNKISVNKTLNPILQEKNRLKIDLDNLPPKKTKLILENRLNEKSPQANRGRMGYELNISPSKGSSPERIQIKYFSVFTPDYIVCDKKRK